MSDMYECFEELRLGLVRLGKNNSAEDLANSLSAGATGTEVLGLAGESLRRIRAKCPELCADSLASAFGRLRRP